MPAGSPFELLLRTGAASARERIWRAVGGADVILANLEAPITDSKVPYSDKRFRFRCARETPSLFDRRFVLGLANNHIFDFGEKGLLDTIEALDARGLHHAGAGRNLEEAGQPAILEAAGLRLGILCAADSRYQAATTKSAGTYPATPELMRESIRSLRKSVEIVTVSIHSGLEFLSVPTPRQIDLAELCMEEGALAVCFHHSHCISGVRRDKRGVVFFGTGNYVFPWGDTPRRFMAWREGAVWRVRVDALGLEIESVDAVPVLLDDEGLPCEASGEAARRILDRIARCSSRLRSAHGLRWWRLREMISPIYLWLNLVNYADIARRHGIRTSLRTMAEGIAVQWTAGRRDG
jgi:poly-gamma-glutamate capsule biosynthesis protein CapA/YwtB (metallophosphatase superfamily)